jgi:hypothetical protein
VWKLEARIASLPPNIELIVSIQRCEFLAPLARIYDKTTDAFVEKENFTL